MVTEKKGENMATPTNEDRVVVSNRMAIATKVIELEKAINNAKAKSKNWKGGEKANLLEWEIKLSEDFLKKITPSINRR